MKRGTLKNGFDFSFDETVADDMRFVDLLVEADDESGSMVRKLRAVERMVDMLLGKEQRERLYEHIAGQNDGRVPVSAFQECFQEIMTYDYGDDVLKN